MPDAARVARRLAEAPGAMLGPLAPLASSPAEPAVPGDKRSREAAVADAAEESIKRIVAGMLARRGTGPP